MAAVLKQIIECYLFKQAPNWEVSTVQKQAQNWEVSTVQKQFVGHFRVTRAEI